MRQKQIVWILSAVGVVAVLSGFLAYCIWIKPPAFLPPQVAAWFSHLPAPGSTNHSTSAAATPVQAESAPPLTAVAEKIVPLPDTTWTNTPVTEPILREPGVRRSTVRASPQSRMLHGEVKAVSSTLGVLVALPPNIGGDGVIPPDTLIADFQRRFEVGERISVAVKGVSMKGSVKQLDLLLVEATTGNPIR